MEEVKEEKMYVLVAPDGSWQAMTLAPDFQSVVAIIRILHSKGIGKSFHELVKVSGYQILPVLVSIKQNGSQDEGFASAKDDFFTPKK